MDTCKDLCLHHCAVKNNEHIKYLIIGLFIGLFLGFLLYKHCNNDNNKLPTPNKNIN